MPEAEIRLGKACHTILDLFQRKRGHQKRVTEVTTKITSYAWKRPFAPLVWKLGFAQFWTSEPSPAPTQALSCRRQVRQVPSSLLWTSQAIAAEKGVIHQKPEIIGLQRHPARRLAVQQRRQPHRSCAPPAQVAHQEFGG